MHSTHPTAPRRAYDESAVRLLRADARRVTVNGSPVSLARATDDHRPGALDPWLVARTSDLAAEQGAGPRPTNCRPTLTLQLGSQSHPSGSLLSS